MKKCTKCGITQPIRFFRSYKKRNGITTATLNECDSCYAKRHRDERLKNLAHSREMDRKRYSEQREETIRYQKAQDEKHRFRVSLTRTKAPSRKHSGVGCTATVEEVTLAFAGFCDICGISEEDSGKKLHLDHDHITGRFRGWLCHSCNHAAGYVHDSPEIARKLALYLEGK